MNQEKYMIKIVDTTLRDGEQAAGVVLSMAHKISTALMLEKLGVDEVEMGTPAISAREKDDITALIAMDFEYDTSCWCRAVEKDIDDCIETGADIVNISIPVSDILLEAMSKNRTWVYELLERLANKKYFSDNRISIGLQDASRANWEFLLDVINLVHENGAFRVRYADTVGILNPMKTHHIIKKLRRNTKISSIEFHGHNDLGMALGNSVAAVHAGADYISGTVNGLGERAGNCPIEELYFALKYSMDIECGGDLTIIKSLSSYIENASGRYVANNKPVTGKMVYTHESGIHVDCLTRDRRSYQLWAPEESGGRNIEYVLGKHSGISAVKAFFEPRNIIVSEAEASWLLLEIKNMACRFGRSLNADEIIDIYRLMPSEHSGKECGGGYE